MWHDDNWQPYAEHDAPSATSNSWRRYRQHGLPMQLGPMGPPVMSHHSSVLGRMAPYHYGRQMAPYARPLPQSHPLMHGHPLAMASRELNWRSNNDSWDIPQMRPRNPSVWHNGPTPLAAAGTDLLKPLVEITTPHAGGELRARPIPIKRVASESTEDLMSSMSGDGGAKRMTLYSDFSEPAKPKKLVINYDACAIRITISWTLPELSSMHKYKQKIEVRDDLTIIEEDTLAPHITSFRFKTIPGCFYVINLSVVDSKNKIVAEGSVECKAMFSLDEIDKLMVKAQDFTGNAMQTFSYLYRCKPKIYWDDIYFRTQGIMERYMKDNNGQAASPINGNISGLFFSARTLADGSIPPSSPFGDIRMIIPAITLLDPNRVSFFFCDFYCNRITHYVTVVVCEKGSETEEFCREKLRVLRVDDNRFLRITQTNNPNAPYTFYVNKSVWVEIYYTENIPLHWGRFDHIMPTGAGTSKIGGLPHNKSCLTCNLYPIGPQPGVNVEPVEDLVATYESQDKSNSTLFPRNSTRYTALGCIQAELLAPSFKASAEISKENYLEVAEVIVYCVDHVVFEQSYEALEKFNAMNAENGSSKLGDDDNFVLIDFIGDENGNHSQSTTEKSDELVIVCSTSDTSISNNNSPDEISKQVEFASTSNDDGAECSIVATKPNESILIENDSMEKFDSSNSVHLIRLLNHLGKAVSHVPMVQNLVCKLKALVKEMDQSFSQLNSDIDAKIDVLSKAENKASDTNGKVNSLSESTGLVCAKAGDESETSNDSLR